MESDFFASALRHEMEVRHFNQAQLAEFLDVDPAYVSRWLKGSSPRIDQIVRVLTALGWDLDRARPSYDPFSDVARQLGEGKSATKAAEDTTELKKLLKRASEARQHEASPPIQVLGVVEKADGQADMRDKNADEVPDFISTFYTCPDYSENDLFILQTREGVFDGRMPHGSHLVMRRVLNASAAAEGALILLGPASDPKKLWLRRLARVENTGARRIERVLGLPINEQQELISLKPREANIHSVAVGFIGNLAC